jgi:hypothetical protein
LFIVDIYGVDDDDDDDDDNDDDDVDSENVISLKSLSRTAIGRAYDAKILRILTEAAEHGISKSKN